MASVAGPRPPGGVPQRFRRPGPAVQPSSVRPPGVQRVRCPARPVSSPSGVQPVRCPARPVSSPSGVQPSGVQSVRRTAGYCPPRSVRTRPSRPTSAVALGDQVEAAGNLHHRNGSSPGGLPRRGAARSTAERARTRATLPGSRWSARVAGDPDQGVGARRRRRLTAERPGRPGRRKERRRWWLRCGHGAGCSARWPQRPRGCRPGLVGDHGGWWSWCLPPGVEEPGGASGRAGGDGRAAPARPRLAAGAPGSLPTAL
jgi:hypothetical protein